ncbi:hypothetical protein D3C79_970090 [compost metagenome]
MGEDFSLLLRSSLGFLQCRVNALTGAFDAQLRCLLKDVVHIDEIHQFTEDFILQALVELMMLNLGQIMNNAIDTLIHQVNDFLIKAIGLLDVEHHDLHLLPVAIQPTNPLD